MQMFYVVRGDIHPNTVIPFKEKGYEIVSKRDTHFSMKGEELSESFRNWIVQDQSLEITTELPLSQSS